MNMAKNMLLWGGLRKDEYVSVYMDIVRENQRILRLSSLIMLLMMIVGCVVKIHTSGRGITDPYAVSYFLFAVVYVLFSISSRTVLNTHPRWVLPFSYAFILSLYVLSAETTLLNQNNQATSFMVFLVFSSALFSDRPVRMIVIMLAAMVVFCVLCVMYKSPEHAIPDIWNTATYGALGIFTCLYSNRIRMKGYLDAQLSRHLSETDVMTGVRNRNSYEIHADEYSQAAKDNLICIYADVNGLHEMNNTHGHKKGDAMLQTVASEMAARFGTENTYRFGGDEFISLAADVPSEDVYRRIHELEDSLAQNQYHVSFGISETCAEGADMEKLLKDAEYRMREAKEQYYQAQGRTRSR